jgi:energy-converting hydrogenase Eha subunit A
MKNKMRIIIIIGIAALVIGGIIFFLRGPSSLMLSDMVMVIIPIILLIGVVTALWDRIKSMRAGLPLEDERAKKLQWKAGAYTYYATIYIALGTMWYNIIFAEMLGYPELTVEQVVAAIIIISAVFWFAFRFYFTRKGDVE